MKYKIILLFISVTLLIGCKRRSGNAGSYMAMDSLYPTDKNVTIVGPRDTIRLSESMKNFEENPNITSADIDAAKQTPSAEIEYVHPGDTLRLDEKANKKEKEQ